MRQEKIVSHCTRPFKSLFDLFLTLESLRRTSHPLESTISITVTYPRQSFFVAEGERQAYDLGDYAFVARNEAALNRDLSNAAEYTRRLSTTYDIGASLNLRAIPKTTRSLLLAVVRGTVEAELQQRDKEPDPAFRIRRAATIASFESLEMFWTQAEEVTLGFNVSSEEKIALAELVITADPKSEFAGLLNQLESSRSRFASRLDAPSALSVSTSLKIDKRIRTFLQEWIAVNQVEFVKELAKPKQSVSGPQNPFAGLLQSVNATVADGTLDFFVQLEGTPPGPFTLVGAIRISEADLFNIGVEDMLARITRKTSDIKAIEQRVAMQRGVMIHELKINNIPEVAKHLFGEDYGIFTGIGNDAIWFSIGAENGLPALTNVIDTIAEAPIEETPVPPAQFVLHLASLLGIAEPPDEQTAAIVERMRESFGADRGTIRADLLPIQDGMRARLTFDEGYIRLIGKSVAARIDDRK